MNDLLYTTFYRDIKMPSCAFHFAQFFTLINSKKQFTKVIVTKNCI